MDTQGWLSDPPTQLVDELGEWFFSLKHLGFIHPCGHQWILFMNTPQGMKFFQEIVSLVQYLQEFGMNPPPYILYIVKL